MHKASVSPTGKFGFPVKTCDGKLAYTVDWNASWASFYRKLLLGVCKLDLEPTDRSRSSSARRPKSTAW